MVALGREVAAGGVFHIVANVQEDLGVASRLRFGRFAGPGLQFLDDPRPNSPGLTRATCAVRSDSVAEPEICQVKPCSRAAAAAARRLFTPSLA